MSKSSLLKTKLNLFTLTTVLALASPAFAKVTYSPGAYQIDLAHSRVGFAVPHMVISTVEGRFDKYQGDYTLADKFNKSKVSVTISTNTVDTGTAKRDAHLRSADFFDVAKYPKMTFRSERIIGSPAAFKMIGDLTIKNVTKEVTLKGKYLGSVNDGSGNIRTAFEASTKVNRKDFGLLWNKLIEAGPLVGDQVTIKLRVEGTRPAPKAAPKPASK